MVYQKKRMLITGVSGLLGNSLAYFFRDKYHVLGLYHSHSVTIRDIQTASVDLLDEASLQKTIQDFDPEILIHCASLTNVDFCEMNEELTEKVNGLGTRFIINAVKNSSTKLVYISTDSVYDGKKGSYEETDPIGPLNVYGLSKLMGEKETLRLKNSLVLRTNIFGWNIQEKNSLAEWILHNLSERKPIQGLKDVFFSSIYTLDLAKILEIAIERNLKGVYNLGSSTSLSKYEFALQIAERFQLDQSLIQPVSLDDFKFKAKRGKNLTLNVTKLARDLDHSLPTLPESLENFFLDSRTGLPQLMKQENRSQKTYPQLDFLPYGRQSIDDDDIDAVVDVLKSPHLTQGPKIAEFESALCAMTGARFAVAVNSGTSALHLACLVAGIDSHAEVVTSANTFVASANCVVYCGGRPVFADIDARTYNLSPQSLEQKLNSRTQAVIPVHFAGQSCEMDIVQAIIKEKENKLGHKIYIIEDASHALGSRFKGQAVGSCTFSDMTVMSFHPVKHITTGEGGVVFTNNEELYQKLKRLRSHGITRDPDCPMPWYYEQIDLGYNYRMTDIQCALGISQLKKLPSHIQRRREIVKTYHEQFRDLKVARIPFESADCVSNFHLYVLLIDFDQIKIDRAQLMTALQKKGVQTQVHYIPVHTQPFYRERFGTKEGDCPNAEKYYKRCLSIPLFPAMTDKDVDKVVDAIKASVTTNKSPC